MRVSGYDPLHVTTTTFVEIAIDNTGSAVIYEHTAANVWNSLGSYALGATVGSTYTLKLTCMGTSCTGYVNGVSRVSATTTITAAGRAGMTITFSPPGYVGSGNAKFDNFQAGNF
jgi:hypothetical protein